MKVSRKCRFCKKRFLARNCPTDEASGRGKYCSHTCSHLARRKLPRFYECRTCGKRKANTQGQLKRFCSRECSKTQFLKGQKPWNYGLKGLRAGSQSHLWRGGRTEWRRALDTCQETRDWRRAVFKRDGFSCQHCGDATSGQLQADHIVPRSYLLKHYSVKSLKQALKTPQLWDVSNGRTLCVSCHKKTATWGEKAKHYAKNKP